MARTRTSPSSREDGGCLLAHSPYPNSFRPMAKLNRPGRPPSQPTAPVSHQSPSSHAERALDQNRQESVRWATDQLEVYEFARHCIVHNRGVVPERAKRLNKGQRNVLKQFTRTSSLANEPRLLPSSHQARNACSHVTSLGLLLFKTVSNTFQLCDFIPELA